MQIIVVFVLWRTKKACLLAPYIYIYIYILTILEGKISSYSRLNLLFNLYEYPQLKQECPHL